MGTARARAILDISGFVNNANRAKDAMRDMSSAGTSGLTGFAQRIDANSARLTALGTVLTGVGVVIGGAFTLGINKAASFEQSMDGVSASLGGVGTASGITKEQFAALSEEALSIGADTSKSATEAAQAMDLLAKAGVDVTSILEGTARAAVMVSEATGESLDQSAATMATLSNLFEHTGISASEMGDVIVNAMNASDASMSELQTGFARLAPVIKGTGMSASDAAAALTYFNMQGFSMAETGTSLAAIFQSVVAPATDEAATALENAGIQAFDAQGKFIGFPALFDQVAEATRGMTDEQKAAFLSTAFMSDGLDLLQTVTGETGDTMRQTGKDMAETGTAAQNSATRMNNLRGDIEQLGGAIETLSIRVGSIFLPAFRMMAQIAATVVDALANLPTPILAVVGALAGITGAAALFTGGLLLMLPRLAEAYLALQSFGGVGGVMAKGLTVARTAVIALRTALMSLLLSPPVLIALAAAIAAVVAYKTNLFGFRDAIDRIREAFRAAKVAFDQFNQAGSTLGAVFKAISAGLESLDIGPLNKLATLLNVTGEAINRFWKSFTDGGGGGETEIQKQTKAFQGFAELAEDGVTWNIKTEGGDQIGRIIDSWDNADGTTTVRIRTEGGEEFETTIDMVTGAVDTEYEVKVETKTATKNIDSFTKRLSKGMRAAGEYLSESNFKGLRQIGRWLEDGADAIDTFGEAFRTARDLGLNPALATVRALGVTFPALSGPMAAVERTVNNLTAGFRNLRDGGVNPISAAMMSLGNVLGGSVGQALVDFGQRLQNMVDLFRDLREAGLSPVQAALQALGATFTGLQGITSALSRYFDEMGNVVTDLVDAFQAAIAGDWPGVFTSLRSAASNAWDAIRAGVSLIGELAQGIGTLAVRIGGWAWEQAVDLYDSFMEHWPTWKATVVDAVKDVGRLTAKIAGWLWEQAQSLAGALAERWPSWVASAKALALDIGQLAAKVAGWTVEQAQSIAGKIRELWPSWVASAKAVALEIGELTAKVSAWAITQGISLAGKIQDLWPTWKASALAVVNDLGTVTANIADWVITQGRSLAGAVKRKIQEWLGEVDISGSDLARIGRSIANALQDAIVDGLQGLADTGARLYSWLADTINGIEWNAVGGVVGEGLGKAIRWAISTLVVGGILQGELFNWIGDAFLRVNWSGLAQSVGSALLAMIGAAVSFSQGFVGGLFKGLFDPIMDEVNAVLERMKDAWNEFAAVVNNAPGMDLPMFDTAKRRADLLAESLQNVKKSMQDALGGVGTEYEQAVRDQQRQIDAGQVPVSVDPRLPGGPQAPSDGGILGRLFTENVNKARAAVDAYRASLDQTTTSTQGYNVTGDRLSRLISSIAAQQQTGATNAYEYSGSLDQLRENSVGAGIGVGLFGTTALSAATSLQTFGAVVGLGMQTAVTSVATGMASAATAITTGTMGWGASLAAGIAPMAGIATVGFGTIRTVATSQLGATLGVVTSTTAGMSASSTANLGAMASNGVSRAASMASGVTSSLSGMRGTAVSTVSSMGSSVASSITTMGTTSSAQVLGMRMGIAASMQSMSSSATSAANSARAGVVSAFVAMAAQSASAVQGGMSMIPGIIGSYAGAAQAAGYSVGSAAGAGIAAGLYAMLGAVQAAAAAIVNTVMVAMAAAARLGSPSKITTQYGKWIGQGMIGGIMDTARDAVRSVRAYMGDMLSEFDRTATMPLWADPSRMYGATAFGGAYGAGGGSSSIVNYYTIADGAIRVTEAGNPAETAREVRREFMATMQEGWTNAGEGN